MAIECEIAETGGLMGVYSEYLGKQLSFDQLSSERKVQLERISSLRGRPIVVYASDITPKNNCPNSIDRSDLLPFNDQISSISGDEIDIILQTPGGFAEVVEDLVKIVRSKFNRVGIIVPGAAYSAGTIFTMAADEILMCPTSSLGPIDAQIISNGKRFSAHAFLEGLKKIQKESAATGKLNIAYIPILQNISPGEIQHCENAQAFSKSLVTTWLKQYKFKFWDKHKSTGMGVTEEEKAERADSIATKLCDQNEWLTHGRSIKIPDLESLRLQIIDYSKDADLYDAINRYHTLLQMSFETNIYKMYETTTSQIYRMWQSTVGTQLPGIPMSGIPIMPIIPNSLLLDYFCAKCKTPQSIQVDFEQNIPLADGSIIFPRNNILKCKNCNGESNLLGLRQQIEAQTGKKIIDGGTL